MEKLILLQFNPTAKIVINHRVILGNAFQEILYRIDNWINEGSGSIVKLIEPQYINTSTYRPLSVSSFWNCLQNLGVQ